MRPSHKVSITNQARVQATHTYTQDGKLGLRSLPKLALLLLSVSLSPLPSCLSSLPTSFLLDFLPHFAHREVESEREDEGREEQGNAVPPQTRATLFVGFDDDVVVYWYLIQ